LEPDNLVEFADVTVQHGGVSILERVDAVVPVGSSTMIVGPNGAGKTTLLQVLLGETRFRGNVRFFSAGGGKPRFGYVPQRVDLDRGMPLTVREFLVAGRQRRPLWLGVSKASHGRATELLSWVGAEHLALRRLDALSGGEMQRVLLAMALEREPELLILDEPSSGMDLQGDQIFCDLLENLRARRGFTQLTVSHDLGLVAHHATHVICLKRAVLAQGPPAQVFSDEILTALFGVHMGVILRSSVEPEKENRDA
jgi:zinc transport system ATP-binding protein